MVGPDANGATHIHYGDFVAGRSARMVPPPALRRLKRGVDHPGDAQERSTHTSSLGSEKIPFRTLDPTTNASHDRTSPFDDSPVESQQIARVQATENPRQSETKNQDRKRKKDHLGEVYHARPHAENMQAANESPVESTLQLSNHGNAHACRTHHGPNGTQNNQPDGHGGVCTAVTARIAHTTSNSTEVN